MFFQIMLGTVVGIWLIFMFVVLRDGYQNLKWEYEKQERMKKAKRE